MTTSAYALPPRPSAPREFVSAVLTIMTKELRSRFRGKRAFIVLTVYLGLLALIAWGVYAIMSTSSRGSFGGAATASSAIGQTIFGVLSGFEMLLICFIAPGFTAGAISLEREKQTLDLLVSTPMRPGAIVVGKLLAALTFILLMITAAIPLNTIVFLYGGVTVGDLVRQQIVLLVAAVGLGTVGLFFSALIRRTQAATVLTYCAMLAFSVGTVLLFFFWSAMLQRDAFENNIMEQRRAPEQLVYLNPAVAMFDVIAGTGGVASGISDGLNQFRPPQDIQGGAFAPQPGRAVVCNGNVCFDQATGQPCAPDGSCPIPPAAPLPADQDSSGPGYFWPRFAISWSVLSLLLTLLSMRMVVPAGMRFVFRRRPPPAEGGVISIPGEGNPMLEDAE
jgi:ABC-type transport system involved in multi-copper enzyme maturation permease subunit